MTEKNIVNYIFEIGQLAKKKNTGWQLIGVSLPPSVSDHIARSAQIGYLLAVLDGTVNPEKVVTIILFHCNGRTRIGDQDKVAARYMFKEEGEDFALVDQLNNFDNHIKEKITKYYDEFRERNTKEGIIAQDADWLEQAFQAKEFYDFGIKGAREWIRNVENALETEMAKKILKEMKRTDFNEWWHGLMFMTYKKLNQ